MFLSIQMKELLILHFEKITYQLFLFIYKIPGICISNLLIAYSTVKVVAGNQRLLYIVSYSVFFNFLFLKWVEQEIILPLYKWKTQLAGISREIPHPASGWRVEILTIW